MNNFWSKLKKPFFVLAPMEAVTDFVFREIVAEIGKPDVLVTEFTSAEALFSAGHDDTIERLKFSAKQKPVIAQIWGTNPKSYFKATELIAELGFNGVDINMGCPARAVMKNNAGAALINDQELTKDLIRAVKEAAGDKIAVSVKTRIGVNKIVTDEWIPFLLEQGVDALAIHGRTSKNGSVDPADWNEIKKSVKYRNEIAPETILIGNGDVKDVEDGRKKAEKYEVDGVMVARGIFTNPWVFEKPMKKHSVEDYLNLMLVHTKKFDETWGKDKNFLIMRKFFKMYVRDFNGAHELRKELMLESDYAGVAKVTKRFLATNT